MKLISGSVDRRRPQFSGGAAAALEVCHTHGRVQYPCSLWSHGSYSVSSQPGHWPQMSGLSPTELETYRKNGFLIWPGRFASAVRRLCAAVDEMLEPHVLGAHHPANPRLDFDGESLKMVEPCLDISPALAAFARSAEVQQIFMCIFEGATPVLFEDKVHMKLPTEEVVQSFGGTGAFPWHQDRVFWSTHSSRLASLVISLDDATEANGALQLLSHPPSAGELPHNPGLHFPLELLASPDNKLAVPTTAVLPAGSAVLFDCMTPHASLPNVSDTPRRSLFLVRMWTPLSLHATQCMHVAYLTGRAASCRPSTQWRMGMATTTCQPRSPSTMSARTT